MNRTIKILGLTTLVLHGVPAAVYAAARVFGSLPSYDAWAASGGNHGPWYGESIHYWIGYALLAQIALVAVSLLLIGLAFRFDRHHRSLMVGLALVGFQMLLIPMTWELLFWTID